MKTTLKPLICTLLFICFCFVANAQSRTDSLRIGVAVEGITTTGTFGVPVNTNTDGTSSTAYKYGAGVSLRVDIPTIEHFNVTASVGYNTYFATSAANTSQESILNVTPVNMETIPVKLGIKWFLGNTFYFQGEAGETILANKSALYGMFSNSFTFSPQVGLLIPLKKKHTYIDGGFRYESFQTFYNDGGGHNKFYALHIAYMFKL
ncbi:MAG: hypothetical protein JWQ79_3264 [Mucilaginibacter sp.]|jgi:hypothetical protein|nr:hypothetical protein [Mucilaginibacter sp.]